MPGIAGLITRKPRAWAEPQLQRMLETLRHESSYVMGTWMDEALGVYAGWMIRKNSFADGMPLRSDRGDVTLIFSGEEYSGRETAASPGGNGSAPKSAKPGYLVDLYQSQEFPANLNGRFQGLLVDRARGIASLFNDRYGLHRLYYHEAADAFYFSAEAKAILKVLPELRSIDPRGLGEFIADGCVLENRTIFRGIQVLPPASRWQFRGGSLERKQSYFDPREWEEQPILSVEDYYRELREVFSRILPRYFQGAEPIGMSLTGGLDTRMIMAWRKTAPGSLPCYSFGGTFRDCEDVRVARRVASVCRQPHQVIPADQEFLSGFPRWAERAVYMTDGCVTVNRGVDLYLNQKARHIAPVRMTGNYGGEVLRRVRAFKPVEPAAELFRPEMLPCIRQAVDSLFDVKCKGHAVSLSAFRQTPWHPLRAARARTDPALTPLLPRQRLHPERTTLPRPRSACANAERGVCLIADGDARLRSKSTPIRGFGANRSRLAAAWEPRLWRPALRSPIHLQLRQSAMGGPGRPPAVVPCTWSDFF